MGEQTNCWILLAKPLADSWESWWLWSVGEKSGNEPNIHEWDKARIKGMIDPGYSFRAFDPPRSWNGREWRLFSVYGVSRGNIDAGIQLHGDAFAGGNFSAIGYWAWPESAQEYSEKIPQIEYRPDIAFLFMQNGKIKDINLSAGQPPRDLRPILNLMKFVRTMESEGWDIKPKGRDKIEVVYNGISYKKDIDYLPACDFEDLPQPLKDDILDALSEQGICEPATQPNIRKPRKRPRKKPGIKPKKRR